MLIVCSQTTADMNVSPENLDSVCEGCLSPDRPDLTTEVTDLDIKKLYYEILNIVENVENLTLRLCAECKSNILKYVAFKKQVIEAHDILNKYLLKSSQNTSSKFASSRLSHPDSTGFNQLQVKRDDDPPPHLPLFIKIEDNADDADDADKADDADNADEYFVDDGCSRDGVNDKNLTAVLQADLIAPNKLKLRIRHKKNEEDDFDASDEEPLHKKKSREADGRDKKSKKSKKKDDSRPKPRAPRREKPAGVVDTPRVRHQLRQLNVPRGHLECVVLSWPEVEAERARALASETFTRHEYRCEHCVLGFNHKFKLTNHMKKHDPSAGELVCSLCAVRCRHKHALAAHRRRHRVRWRCCVCGAAWSRAGVAADHLARDHAAARPQHRCQVCGETLPSLAKLRGHMKEHGSRQACELCHKSFRDRAALRTHLFIHSGEKEHACPRCDKRFLFKKAMQLHLVTHDASAHLYCHECDLNFKNRMSYKQHMKYSLKHVDPAKLKYACALCDKKFLKASRLREHELAVHLKQTPVLCAVPGCGFACSSRPVLRTHTRMRHRGGRAVRNHVCHTCGKTYMTKKTLEGHLRSHTGERPFRCAHCSATFGYEAALYNHNKRVHRDGKLGRAFPPALPPAPAPQAT